MKKIITYTTIGLLTSTALGILFYSNNACSRVTAIEDWLYKEVENGGPNGNLKYDLTPEYKSCSEYPGGFSEIPANKTCNTIKLGKLTCYVDCQCSPAFSYTCSGKAVGKGTACDGKFTACTCPDNYAACEGIQTGVGTPCTADGGEKYADCECPIEYTLACDGAGEIGSDDGCNDKYRSCKCKTTWTSCPGNAGRGTACTADGVLKFSSCQAGSISSQCHNSDALFDGRARTQEIIDSLGSDAITATAAVQFYAPGVAADDPNFGQGHWYLPAIGELMQLVGWDFTAARKFLKRDPNSSYVNDNLTTEGRKGDNLTKVNNSLVKVGGTKFITTSSIQTDAYVSSSIISGGGGIDENGNRVYNYDYGTLDNYKYSHVDGIHVGTTSGSFNQKRVRVTALLKNAFTDNDTKPKIGDIMYSDKSYSADKISGKTAVGIVYWVSDDGNSARIINLKDLTKTNSFDPANPYGGNYSTFPQHDIAAYTKQVKTSWILRLRPDYYGDTLWIPALGDFNFIGNCQCPDNYIICPHDKGIGNACTADGRPKFASCNSISKTCLGIGILHDGYNNTQAAITQLGDNALAATAANQYYVPGIASDDPHFGQGKWYIPAFGEIADLVNADLSLVANWNIKEGQSCMNLSNDGYYFSDFTDPHGLNTTLTQLGGDKISGMAPSTELNNNYLLGIFLDDWGNYQTPSIATPKKASTYYIRPIVLLEDAFIDNEVKPVVGDVIYSDMSYGNISALDSSKIPVGVVFWISDTGNSARVISLKNLTFNSQDQAGNFDPQNPYGNTVAYSQWATTDTSETDIEGIENIAETNGTCNLKFAIDEICRIKDTNNIKTDGTGRIS